MELAEIRELADRLREQTARVVLGQGRAVELLLTALLAEGHVLLEGVPGTAKTLLARAFAACLSLRFGRIRVTLDGVTHALGDGFMVIATQNPIEQEGTYPLPEAQLDRFLFKVIVDYPE